MIVSSLLLGLHLVTVNLAATGPLFCVLVQWRSAAAQDAALARIGKQLLAASLIAFFVGGVAGYLNGQLWWNDSSERLAAAMDRLASKIYFGWWELGFYVVCLLVYAGWWYLRAPRSVPARLGHALFAVLASTNLLWHFPPLMTILTQVAANEPLGDHIDASEFRHLMFSASVFPRWVHVWLASIAVGGITLALLGACGRGKGAMASPAIERCIISGVRWALFATLLQAAVGAWVLFSSPAIEQSRLMGEDLPATTMLIVSIAAALWLMHLLGSIAVSPASRKQIAAAAALMLFVIFAMSATTTMARGNALYSPIERKAHSNPIPPP